MKKLKGKNLYYYLIVFTFETKFSSKFVDNKDVEIDKATWNFFSKLLANKPWFKTDMVFKNVKTISVKMKNLFLLRTFSM